MNPAEWNKVKEIVAEALDCADGERPAFLAAACGTDSGLRKEVESLLSEQDRAGKFLLDSVIPAAARLRPFAPGEVLANRFEIVRLIGQGGMGTVYEARDRELGGAVALKAMQPFIAADPQAAARFKREIQVAKRITHPNVCRIYDLGLHKGASEILFFTMELLMGGDLAGELKCDAMDASAARPLILQMAAALEAAHEAGIVHGDFKPSNVFLAADREQARVVVTDFGLARPAGSSPEQAGAAGTPDYMAPEQFSGGVATPASDIYALGIVIYEMVTGRRPFEAETFLESAVKRLEEAPEPPRRFARDLSASWERIILRCLSRKPEDRFGSAAEVAAALRGGEAALPEAVKCPQCQQLNPTDSQFCERCGKALRCFWIAGSGRDCHIVVAQPTVSAQHCRVTAMGSSYLIEDLGSRNGTWLDGRRIEAPAAVAWGADVTLGSNVPFPWERIQAKIIRIGRAPDNDIILDHELISAHHARLTIDRSGITIEDLGSTNGTAAGNPQNRIASSPLMPNDTVFFGTVPVPVERLISGKAALGAAAHADVVLHGTVTLGRDPQCQKVLDHLMVSWRHARLSQTKNGYEIEDLGSTNGTFVNGRRITKSCAVAVGDTIGLGTYTFQFTGGSTFQERDYRGNVTLEARNIAVDAGGRRLIEGISLTIFPSEIVGVIGVAGAGKTTLMNALNGYSRPAAGSVLINGQDLYRSFDRFRGRIGYAPQDDIMHRELTVFQALYYTARLRLPADYTDEAIRERIRKVLEMLAIQSAKDVIIGSPERKGISGGQRKRVNLAMELLTDPDILFLDEPTSGLSSVDALMVMKVLRRLADAGKTILVTIHQPSLEVFRMMDTLAIIGKDKGTAEPGRLVYFGSAYPDAVTFFNPGGIPGLRPGMDPSPDEILSGLEKQKSEYWVKAYSESRYKRDYVDGRSGKQPASGGQDAGTQGPARRTPQWGTLAARALAVKLQDRAYTAMLLGQSVFVGLFVALVCGSNRKGEAVFGMIMAALFSGCLNAAREIVGEWAVYHRERMVRLRLAPYVASKLTVLGGLCILQCGILAVVVGVGCGLEGGFIGAALLLTLASLVALGYGLIISAISRTSERAMALIAPILMPMLLLGGALPKLRDTTRPVARLLPSRWGFEAMLQVQQLDVMRNVFFPASDQFRVAAAVWALAAMLAVLTAVLALVLKGRDTH